MIAIALSLWLAAAPPLERDPAFKAARARYDDFEFDDAGAAFRTLLKRPGLTDAERARVWLWIAMCEAENGALADAASSFEEAAQLDPDVKPLSSMSPKARRMLDDARARVLEAARPPPEPEPDPPPLPRPDDDDAPAAARASSPLPLLGAGGLVAAGVGVGTGAVLGVLAQGAYAEAEADRAAADATARYADAQQLATFANVAYAVAGVAVVTSAALLGVWAAGDDS